MANNFLEPTKVQKQSLVFLNAHVDMVVAAKTGQGKTLCFGIPIMDLLLKKLMKDEQEFSTIKALIMSPTRELAIQIGESIAAYGRNLSLRHEVIFGGVSQVNQVNSLKKGVDIIVATPGRLLDLMQQGFISLDKIKYFVLDEADRMLDMGFIQDVKRVIAKLPAKRQSLFFSATMPREIQQLADMLLKDPVKVEVTPVSSTVEIIDQKLYYVEKQNKQDLLLKILEDQEIVTLLVFTQMKYAADRIARFLTKSGIKAAAIHGNKSQNARQNALSDFKNKKLRVLVATDIAARGIDIDELSHVLNFELPNVPETYVHRIGRTGRAGATGVAISFCDWSEKTFLTDIQKLIKKTIPVVKDHPFDNPNMHSKAPEPKTSSAPAPVNVFRKSRRARSYGRA